MKKIIIIAVCVAAVAGGAVLLSQKNNGQPASQNNGQPASPEEAKTQRETKPTSSAIDDVCNYFPKELVEQAIGRPIVKVEGSFYSSYTSCYYYTDWQEDFGGDKPGGPSIIVLAMKDNVEDIKAELEQHGNILETDPSIQGEHYTVRSPVDNVWKSEIWRVDIVLGPEKVIEIKDAHGAASSEELVKIAAKFAEKINQ